MKMITMPVLELKKGDKVAFNYYHPISNITLKYHGIIRKRIREGENSYVISFKEENGILISNNKKDKVIYHHTILDENNFIKLIEHEN